MNKVYRFCRGIIAFALLLSTSVAAHATVIYVDAAVSVSGTGTSWATAYGTLQEALTAANGNSAITQVWLKAGTYYPTAYPAGSTNDSITRDYAFTLKNGLALYGGFAGTETALSQRVPGNTTILSGDIGVPGDSTDNCYHVIISVANNNTAKLDGITITGGNANGNGGIVMAGYTLMRRFGGGMWNHSSIAGISNCIFTGNSCTSLGGGIYNGDSSATTITGCVFSGNSSGSGGGGIFNSSVVAPVISRCLFSGNRSTLWGAGIYGTDPSTCTITNTVFAGNTANSGGGIYSESNAVFNIASCTFYNNMGSSLCNGFYSLTTITNSIFWSNPSSGSPAIYNNWYVADVTYSDVQGGYTGTGNINTDPHFINASSLAGADGVFATADDGLAITTCSPAQDAGTLAGMPATDITGAARPQGGGADMGAYEQAAASQIPNITITATGSIICAGSTVTFTAATVNGGASPAYQWLKNGSAISGATGSTYTTSTLSNGDIISAVLSGNLSCSITTDTSNAIPITVHTGSIAYVDGSYSYSDNGNSWSNPFRTVQEALTLASNCNSVTQIWVKSGTYHPTALPAGMPAAGTTARDYAFTFRNGLTVYGGFAGTETSVAQRVAGNASVFSGDIGTPGDSTDNCYHVIIAAGTNNTAKLDRVTVVHGNADGTGAAVLSGHGIPRKSGGGLYCNGASPVLTSCVFYGNAATDGGGVCNDSSSATAFTNCIIAANTGTNGGGMENGFSAAPVIMNSTVAANSSSAAGGGMYNTTGALPVVTNCILWNNTAATGSGIAGVGTPVVTYCDVQGGYAGTGNINADPLFANAATPSGADGAFGTADDGLTLPACSPAQNTGTAAGAPAIDIKGTLRPQGIAVDMGAYEQTIQPSVPIVTIATGTPFACAGSQVSFSVTSVGGGGTTPVYEWFKNGLLILGANGISYSTTTLSNGDVIRAVLISSLSCITTPTDTSNDVTITVHNGATAYVDAAAAPGGSGNSWATAFQKVQDAISLATSCSSVTQVWIKSGTYYPTALPQGVAVSGTSSRDYAFKLRNGLAIYGGFAGTETALSQRVPGNTTTLSGDIGVAGDISDNCFHVIISTGNNSTAVLDGVTIAAGNANYTLSIATGGYTINRNSGGGMYNESSSPAISNCIFSLNRGDYGAGMYSNLSSPTLTKCVFLKDSMAYDGGGMYNNQSSAPVITNCVFAGSDAILGGAMYNESSPPVIVNSTFAGNGYINGSGIYNNNYSYPVITNCIVWGNTGQGLAITDNSGSLSYVTYSDVQNTIAGTGNINANPLFPNIANPAGPDGIWGTADDGLKIATCSPAQNTGTATGAPATDITGTTRPQGGGVDMGAYEQNGQPIMPLVTIVASNTAVCPGTAVTFTITSVTNGGTSPAYQWLKNGTAIPGATASTYTSSTLANGDAISLQLVSSMPCATNNTSNSITVSLTVQAGGIVYVDSSLTSSGNGNSWATAYKTLQEAMAMAYNCSSVTQVWIRKGTYYPTAVPMGMPASGTTNRDYAFALRNNLAIYGGFAGTETAVTQRVAGNTTILSGEINIPAHPQDNCYHILLSSGNDTTAKIDGLTIQDAWTNGSGTGVGTVLLAGRAFDRTYGGGLYNNGSSPKVTNCVFYNNNTARGGGICNNVSSPAISGCTFTGNSAVYGSGIHSDSTSLPVVTNCTLNANPGVNAAMDNLNGSDAIVSHCMFINNACTFAGGMYNQASDPAVTNCVFSGNGGGGVYCMHSGAHITNCIMANNSGSGMTTNGDATPVVTNCIFYHNVNSSGGGLWCLSNDTPILTNCTFYANTASNGTGIFYYSTAPKLINCLLRDDTTQYRLEINNDPFALTGSLAITYSNVAQGYPGTGNINADPLFVDPSNPIGPDGIWGTSDDGLMISPCSPSVNAGTNAGAPTTDIVGTMRPQGSTADIGAYEQVNNTIQVSICAGATYILGSQTYTTSGTYTTTLAAAGGCDSIITLQLTVLPLPVLTYNSPVLSAQAGYTIYEWLLNGQQVANSIDSFYTASQNGSYTVTTTDSLGCTSTSAPLIVTGLGINKHILSDVTVYPNPVSSVVNVTAPMPVVLSLCAMDGKELYHTAATSIDLTNLANGLYILKVLNAQGVLLQQDKLLKNGR